MAEVRPDWFAVKSQTAKTLMVSEISRECPRSLWYNLGSDIVDLRQECLPSAAPCHYRHQRRCAGAAACLSPDESLKRRRLGVNDRCNIQGSLPGKQQSAFTPTLPWRFRGLLIALSKAADPYGVRPEGRIQDRSSQDSNQRAAAAMSTLPPLRIAPTRFPVNG